MAGYDVVDGELGLVEVFIHQDDLAFRNRIHGAALIDLDRVLIGLAVQRLRIGLLESLAQHIHVNDFNG